MRRVYIAEDTDWDEQHDTWALGTFSGHVETDDGMGDEFEDLPLEAALAWGRERAAAVYIRLAEGDYYSAGTEHPPDLEPWPPAELPELVRRRPEYERWKDRTEADPPISWAVTAWVSPADDTIPKRRDDEPIRAVAERAGVHFDLGQLAKVRRQLPLVQLRAWLTRRPYLAIGHMAYRLRWEQTAATAGQAEALAADRLELPAGWQATFEVGPSRVTTSG